MTTGTIGGPPVLTGKAAWMAAGRTVKEADLTPDPGRYGWFTVEDGRTIQIGYGPESEAPVGLMIEPVDLYVTRGGTFIAAARIVTPNELHEARSQAEASEASAEAARTAAADALAEYHSRKDRDYFVTTVPGTIAGRGVNLDQIRAVCNELGVQLSKGAAGRALVSVPAGRTPSVAVAIRARSVADVAARFADLLALDSPKCDVAKCSKPGVWVTDSGGIICDKHAGRSS